MNQLIIRRLGFALAILAAVFFIPTFIAAQGQHPPIPHALEGFEDCLGCHETGTAGAPEIPDNHIGIKNDVCVICHKPIPKSAPVLSGPLPVPHALTGGYENCVECHSIAVPTPTGHPQIPHTLIDRENCLDCHREGDDITPKIPDDHTNLTSDACQGCHQPKELFISPTPTPVPLGPVPTPIVHLGSPAGVNTCFDCHATLEDQKLVDSTDQWQRSIHAEREVTCVDCHGGDPSVSSKEGAKSSDAGYVGVPDRSDIPALCASCHADVSLMRQYDLPTDQFAKYRESIHGIRLAEGDPNVATCSDCHSGHLVLKANDPASTVYPANVPGMCARCHADQNLMAPYEILTNQFDLYRQSVHGHALLDEHNFRAPNCATCHGTHGAAPPGFEEVANVCGGCHSATQDYYLASPHASGSDKTPECVTCHGRYDVSKPSEALFLGAEPRHCGSCHSPDSEAGQVSYALYNVITAAAEAYEEGEAAIQAAREASMIVTSLEGRLREANTNLITARAAQHNADFDTVNERAQKAQTIAKEVKAGAEAAVADSIFRRQAMVIAVVIIVLTIIPLYLLKLKLDRRLDAD